LALPQAPPIRTTKKRKVIGRARKLGVE